MTSKPCGGGFVVVRLTLSVHSLALPDPEAPVVIADDKLCVPLLGLVRCSGERTVPEITIEIVGDHGTTDETALTAGGSFFTENGTAVHLERLDPTLPSFIIGSQDDLEVLFLASPLSLKVGDAGC
jgi:hypothetical protein